MSKLLKTLMAATVILGAGLFLCTGCGDKAKAKTAAVEEVLPVITTYAPADANVIVYINLDKITQDKVYKKVNSTKKAQKELADADKELAKYNLKLEDFLQSEICFFLNAEKAANRETRVFCMTEFKKAMANNAVEAITKAAEEDKAKGKDSKAVIDKTDIAGHKAFCETDDEGAVCVIGLPPKRIQGSFVHDAKAGVDKTLLVSKETDFTKSVNPDALISVSCNVAALKIPPEVYKQARKNGAEVLLKDLTFATLNVTNANDIEKLEIRLVYKTNEEAIASAALLNAYRSMGKALVAQIAAKDADENTKKALEYFDKIKIEPQGSTVTVSIEEKADVIISQIPADL